MVKNCEYCGNVMVLRISKQGKNKGEIIKIHQTKRFCNVNCQNNWQKNITWEERVGKDIADKIRKETSERVSGDNNPTHNPEIAKKVSNSLKKYLKENPRTGDKNPFFGKNHTEEYKEWASDSRKGKWSYDSDGYERQKQNTPKGDLHPNWNGGTSCLPYTWDFRKTIKLNIKIRDNYTCNICEKETQKLAVHHIDYDKNNSDEKNLISLCYSCHSKTNYHRDNWVVFFSDIINKKYVKMTD